MNDFDKLKDQLKSNISKKRYIHTLGVVEKAEELARFYDGDINKTRIAALLHDCAKKNEVEYYEKYKDQYSLDREILDNDTISHQVLGAIACKEEYKVEDKEILSAISCHTTGKANMSKLDKIIYIADAIEKNRNYPGIEELRKKEFLGLDDMLIAVMNNVIIFLTKSNFVIDYRTIEARNFYVRRKD